ncbi:TetR/AcrR family transcriptional regulator [Pararhodobacter zhoushanensis]|uniref:TetR/AcrR family transcriptional regulator n=1 Tax=Pararhodobacter zhoushanensis TaxID=2479545 RepID=UPI000F8D7B66|nr:TetR/AcrR family transcriptional regulator C-terminal domain-containing protein [Pararhodobacter zhoushanensis]
MAKKTTSGQRRGKGTGQSAPELSKAQIVETALRLIDDKGLQSFSIRNLAKTLECYPTAIYWYTPSRHFLIAEIITIVLADVVPDLSLGWQEWLRALFRRYRAAISKHPNVAPLIGVNLVSNAAIDLDMIEGTLAKLHEAGFRDEALINAYNAVIGGMVGFTTQEFAMLPPDAEDFEANLKDVPQRIDRDLQPHLAQMAPRMLGSAFILRWQNGAAQPMDGAFAMYVEAFVTGLEAALAPDPSQI